MSKDNNKKKKVITIVISIVIVLVLVLSISYAYFSTQLSGTDQIVKVGELELVLNETSEGISLENAIGLSDSDGMKLTPSTFELKNNGNKAVDYTIYLDDNTIGDNDTRIDDKYLKYNLNKNGLNSGATMLTRTGANPNRVLDTGTIEGGETNKYSLNLWITDEVDGNYSGQVFSGKLRVEVSQEKQKLAEVLLADSANNINTDDPEQTFITGEDPNNYIWYSGKLWRAVSVNNEEKTVKLVTQWNISAIPYDDDSSAFEGSYMEEWLNDTTADGFLGNLRDYEDFIVTDAIWDSTMDSGSFGELKRPDGTQTVIAPVGLLNIYEYQSSYDGTDYSKSYLNNKLDWVTLTPYNANTMYSIGADGAVDNYFRRTSSLGIRPSVLLKSNVAVQTGVGTEEDPYRLYGDNDINLQGTLLNTRYSGEYLTFGISEDNLYRIISHETEGLTKIASARPLKSSRDFIKIAFGDNVNYSNTNTIGTFLNGEYITNYIGEEYNNMIEDSTTWYLGTVGNGTSYKLAKYTDTSMLGYATSTDSKVGLLRLGELMSGQFDRYGNNTTYWTLTPYSASFVRLVGYDGRTRNDSSSNAYGVRPSINLKSNVIITSGDGTLQNPFQVELAD